MFFYVLSYILIFGLGEYWTRYEWMKDVKRAQRLKEGKCHLYSKRGE